MSPLAAQLAGKRVVICAGAGGVGKTTVSAAIGLGLAAAGQRVAVVTIDPARRLAEALGLDRLGNEPQQVDLTPQRLPNVAFHGELFAMMLDVKQTFDDLIGRLAPDQPTRDRIIANPIYRQLSTAVAGSQEYTAIAKLFELTHEGDYDVIVVDTPPSRSALDFLRAPERLIAFLEGRSLQSFLAPAGPALGAARLMFSGLRRITGIGLLDDLTSFFQLISGLLDGFHRRAADVEAMLRDPATAFVIVTSAEHAALDEAIRFAAELDRTGMHRAGVILNRVHPLDPTPMDPLTTTRRLTTTLGTPLAEKVARTHADVQRLAHRDTAAVERLHAAMRGPKAISLADRERDVHDLVRLLELQGELFGDPETRSRAVAS